MALIQNWIDFLRLFSITLGYDQLEIGFYKVSKCVKKCQFHRCVLRGPYKLALAFRKALKPLLFDYVNTLRGIEMVYARQVVMMVMQSWSMKMRLSWSKTNIELLSSWELKTCKLNDKRKLTSTGNCPCLKWKPAIWITEPFFYYCLLLCNIN